MTYTSLWSNRTADVMLHPTLLDLSLAWLDICSRIICRSQKQLPYFCPRTGSNSEEHDNKGLEACCQHIGKGMEDMAISVN